MKCTSCNTDTKVVETRGGVIRRRHCTTCGTRFTTVEVLRDDLPDDMVPDLPKRTRTRTRTASATRARPARTTRPVPAAAPGPKPPAARKRIEDLQIDRAANTAWWDL